MWFFGYINQLLQRIKNVRVVVHPARTNSVNPHQTK